MSVEQLIEKLQKMPPHYEVKAYEEGCDIGDFSSDVFEVELWSPQKEIHLTIETGREREDRYDWEEDQYKSQ